MTSSEVREECVSACLLLSGHFGSGEDVSLTPRDSAFQPSLTAKCHTLPTLRTHIYMESHFTFQYFDSLILLRVHLS